MKYISINHYKIYITYGIQMVALPSKALTTLDPFTSGVTLGKYFFQKKLYH